MSNASSGSAEMSDIDQLHAIRRGLEAAENAADATYIGAMMADDAVIMVPNEPVQEGGTACAAFIHRMLAESVAYFIRRITYVSAEACVAGQFAFDRGSFVFTVQPKGGGDITHATGKYLWLYSRRDGGWKLSRLIVCLDDEPER